MKARIPIPARMAHLPLDPRGFPIPVVVLRDSEGKPVFQVNNSIVQRRCTLMKLCPICGEKLPKELWFAGGPGSALHPHGWFIDTAMHHECMTYALQTCPYLALPNYFSKLNTDAAYDRLQTRAPSHAILVDNTVDARRPRFFVAVMSYGQHVGTNLHVQPLRPYHDIEFWRHGKKLDYHEGREIVAKRKDLDLSMLRLTDKRNP